MSVYEKYQYNKTYVNHRLSIATTRYITDLIDAIQTGYLRGRDKEMEIELIILSLQQLLNDEKQFIAAFTNFRNDEYNNYNYIDKIKKELFK
jgi:hypothetical protein